MTSGDDLAKPADYTFLMHASGNASPRMRALHKGYMQVRFTTLVLIGVTSLALGVGLSAQHKDAAHRHQSAAKMKNPVAATPESIASGRKLYDRHCSECHGDTGKGDGMAGEGLDERPSNLVDGEWEHGSTDGEIFVVIRDGAGPKSEMKAFAKKIPDRQIWDVVNFVRTFNKTTR
jgi:mono/diheme cytochrome c family protein